VLWTPELTGKAIRLAVSCEEVGKWSDAQISPSMPFQGFLGRPEQRYLLKRFTNGQKSVSQLEISVSRIKLM